MNQRLAWIDIAKGIGIILIVLGHNYVSLHQKQMLFRIIFSFHIPLFFFLSGIFFNPQYNTKTLLQRRFNSLIRPYFATCIIYVHLKLVLDKHFSISSAFSVVAGAVYSTDTYLFWAPLWFITCLFATQLFFKKMWHFLYRLRLVWARVTVVSGVLVIGILTMKHLWHAAPPACLKIGLLSEGLQGLPWSVDVVLVSAFFYYLGYECMQSKIDMDLVAWYLPLFSILLFLILHLIFPYTIDLNMRRYDNILICTIEAILGIYIVLSLSHLISKGNYSYIKDILSLLGNRSIIILLFHYPLQQKAFYLLNDRLGYDILMSSIISFVIGLFGPIVLYYVAIANTPILKKWYPQVNAIKGN